MQKEYYLCVMEATAYTDSLFSYKRIATHEVKVGELSIGGSSDIRIQSMTTTDTNDTEASVEQSVRIIEAGGELVRLTTQGRAEADNIKNIKARLRALGFLTPLVADVHFNPNAALIAAGNVEKVRINPGNFTGEQKKFSADADNMTDDEWMNLIISKLTPLVEICKANGTTLRIGVNHGSLSDRIMAKYGDTPQGMVASCTEYIDALEKLDFDRIVISIKSSNTRVMVETVRLLSATMRMRGKVYPMHLGVTEAGSDTEGRIKSAAGIGALLIDGIGDTVRVSLTEAPESEVPVAMALVDYIVSKAGHATIASTDTKSYSPFEYHKRDSVAVAGIGGQNKPIVVGNTKDAELSTADISTGNGGKINFIRLTRDKLSDSIIADIKRQENTVVVAEADTTNPTAEIRALILELNNAGCKAPVIVHLDYKDANIESFQLKAAADAGLLFIDGLADGLMLTNKNIDDQTIVETSLQILQATKVRYSKAEFISCPGCGRTLYDIQQATRKIKSIFGHLKGVKIAVMGCIVNGIGEMADADYGYVGAGHGKISLYRGKELIKRAIDEQNAIDELINIIKEDKLWIDAQ